MKNFNNLLFTFLIIEIIFCYLIDYSLICLLYRYLCIIFFKKRNADKNPKTIFIIIIFLSPPIFIFNFIFLGFENESFLLTLWNTKICYDFVLLLFVNLIIFFFQFILLFSKYKNEIITNNELIKEEEDEKIIKEDEKINEDEEINSLEIKNEGEDEKEIQI
jgi:hypothetical protein